MGIYFVLGNGRSRLAINPLDLRRHGPIYGCNGLYREFVPDVLVATDRPIAKAIEDSKYPLRYKFYTRHATPNTGSIQLQPPYRGYSSGPNAIGLACQHGATKVYMLGFDFGSPTPLLNNVYADTEFYKKSRDKATFAGNWVKQLIQICKDYPDVKFIRVIGPESSYIPEFADIPNLQHQQINDFRTLLNSKEGRP